MKKYRVALTWYPIAKELELVRSILPGTLTDVIHLETSYGATRYSCPPPQMRTLLAQADFAMGWAPIPAPILREANSLKFIAWLHWRTDTLDRPLLDSRKIVVKTIGQLAATAASEYAIAFMMCLAKRTRMNNDFVRLAQWRGWWDPATSSNELLGSTVCIIGYGAVGRALAKICSGFGLRVLAIRSSESRADGGADQGVELGGPSQMRTYFERADYLVLALPLTADTRGLINEERLSWLKPTAHVINISPAEVVVEAPLHSALTESRLSGYASQSWWDYEDTMPPGYHFPIASRLGIHQLPNVLAAGESAANVLTVRDRLIKGGAAAVAAFAHELSGVNQ
jgi:phosphoglycerate dehydrogenase-like enzyme